MSIPPAHKRLVPRKPRKDTDGDATPAAAKPAPAPAKPEPPAPQPRASRPSQPPPPDPAPPKSHPRAQSRQPAITEPARPAARQSHRAVVPRSSKTADPPPRAPHDDDALEVTSERAPVRAPRSSRPLPPAPSRRRFESDEVEITLERRPITPNPDEPDLDAAETFALMRPEDNPLLQRRLPLDPNAVPAIVARRPFPEAEPTAPHTPHTPHPNPMPMPVSVRDLYQMQGIDANAFAVVEPTVLEAPEHSPVRMQDLKEIEANAFAELEPTALKPANQISGIEDRPLTHVSPAERGFLAAMAEGHEPSRLKYIDWLERRGERARAEYLRLDHELFTMNPRDIRYEETYQRLRECAERISVDWRSRVARSTIEGCMTPGGQCPTYWRSLTDNADDVRQCHVCREHVYYCVTMELARMRLAEGQLVAIDVTCQRWPGDLQPAVMQVPHCGSCGCQVPHGTRFCPHCGQPQ